MNDTTPEQINKMFFIMIMVVGGITGYGLSVFMLPIVIGTMILAFFAKEIIP